MDCVNTNLIFDDLPLALLKVHCKNKLFKMGKTQKKIQMNIDLKTCKYTLNNHRGLVNLYQERISKK